MGQSTAARVKGATIADTPVVQNSTYEFTVNLRAAKLLGIVVPPAIMAAVDEVIE